MKTQVLKTSALVVPLLVLALVACRKDEIPTVSVPDGDIVFLWNDKESQTVTVESDYDWSFEEVDEYNIIEVSRSGASNTLVVTPNINYASQARTATINIISSSGAGTTQKSIKVSQGANDPTYLNFLDSDIAGQDNPVILFESSTSGEPTEREILLVTNNVLSVDVSSNQDVTVSTVEEYELSTKSVPKTKVEIPGYGWLTYDITENETSEGTITVLTLVCQVNESTTENQTVELKVTAGNEEIDNTIVSKNLGIVSLPSTPSVVVNPSEGLVFTYDATEQQTFTVVSNVEYTIIDFWSPTGSGTWDEFPKYELLEDNGNIKVYGVTVPQYTQTSDRSATMQFRYDYPEIGETLYASLTVLQTGAPVAEVTLDSSELIFNNDEDEKLVYVTSTLPAFTTVTYSDTWFTAEYMPDLGVVLVSLNVEPSDEERTGTVTFTAGSGLNTGTATLTVRQLSLQPTIVLSPESVQLNQNGDAVTVTVTTNQDSWSLSGSSSDFTVTEDHTANTITVSGTAITSGERTASYTVTAGTAEATLSVSQKVAYQLGDPYVVNGKTVGIVYEVDADGMHGKAFSLTVYNLSDKYFFYEPIGWVDSSYGAWIDDGAVPTSLTNGQLNCQTMKNEPNWESKFLALKWVEDLADSQGVDWYIPAIEELKTLVSYMSDAEFIDDEMDTSDTDKIEAAWDKIRNIYKQYTASSPDYSEEQYVVFQWCTYDANGDPYEIKDLRHYVDDPYEEISDNYAYVWYSSSVVSMTLNQWLYTVNMQEWQSTKGYPVVRNNTGAVAYYDDYEYQAGSVHPICQF